MKFSWKNEPIFERLLQVMMLWCMYPICVFVGLCWVLWVIWLCSKILLSLSLLFIEPENYFHDSLLLFLMKNFDLALNFLSNIKFSGVFFLNVLRAYFIFLIAVLISLFLHGTLGFVFCFAWLPMNLLAASVIHIKCFNHFTNTLLVVVW